MPARFLLRRNFTNGARERQECLYEITAATQSKYPRDIFQVFDISCRRNRTGGRCWDWSKRQAPRSILSCAVLKLKGWTGEIVALPEYFAFLKFLTFTCGQSNRLKLSQLRYKLTEYNLLHSFFLWTACIAPNMHLQLHGQFWSLLNVQFRGSANMIKCSSSM